MLVLSKILLTVNIVTNGEINGYMMTNCETRTDVIEYLSILDLSREQKNSFYIYWKGWTVMKEINARLTANKKSKFSSNRNFKKRK